MGEKELMKKNTSLLTPETIMKIDFRKETDSYKDLLGKVSDLENDILGAQEELNNFLKDFGEEFEEGLNIQGLREKIVIKKHDKPANKFEADVFTILKEEGYHVNELFGNQRVVAIFQKHCKKSKLVKELINNHRYYWEKDDSKHNLNEEETKKAQKQFDLLAEKLQGLTSLRKITVKKLNDLEKYVDYCSKIATISKTN